MSGKNTLAARAAAITGQKVTVTQMPREPASTAAVTTTSGEVPRVKPVRVVVELQPVEHRNLRRLADRYADEIGVPQVAMAEVLRVLLNIAQQDKQTAAKVGKELARTGGTRRR